ncbi:MAG TPA: LamG-like jellyroll fold domain-containing protein [Chitinophagaceae bacterium]|nr:LamG-like jellyroll fold domain-containing protein [Chitinophagaceae bacterium]
MQKPTCIAILLAFLSFSVSAQFPSGCIGRWLLNNSAVDASGNGYNGSLTSTSATTNRFGTASQATSFNSGSSNGSLPVGLITAMQNDFSYGFWFKTSMTASNSSAWYGGNALVDAEVCGGVADYGTALIDGGKVCLGIGNPDLTIKTPLSYNDGNWHFATAVRDKAAGAIYLYIDGLQKASTTGTTTAALTSPAFMGLGKNPCANNPVYTGSLDDIVGWGRALSGTEVLNLYNYMAAQALPVHWLSFTGVSIAAGIQLKWEIDNAVNNDRFEIEHSKDGRSYSMIASIQASTGIGGAGGKITYNYLHISPAGGNHFYRIKEVDIDGKFSYSSVIRVDLNHPVSGFSLKNNPVKDELVLLNANRELLKHLIILDASGRVQERKILNTNASTVPLDIQRLSTGYYFLMIVKQNGESEIFPFMNY